ncbi:MAG: site-specific integrase, partial [SAR324 cluster bacterium]|nr:site-specific integrase [SAR324 cluster bacterium]
MDEQKIDLILKGFYECKSSKTGLLYQTDLDAFRNYLGVGTVQAALINLFESPHSRANLTVIHYKSLMLIEGLKPATVNRRLSALRSLTKEARRNGFLKWKLDVSNEKLPPGHKNKPLDNKSFEEMLEKAGSQRNALKSARD